MSPLPVLVLVRTNVRNALAQGGLSQELADVLIDYVDVKVSTEKAVAAWPEPTASAAIEAVCTAITSQRVVARTTNDVLNAGDAVSADVEPGRHTVIDHVLRAEQDESRFNDLARVLGIPRDDIAAAVDVLAEGRLRSVPGIGAAIEKSFPLGRRRSGVPMA